MRRISTAGVEISTLATASSARYIECALKKTKVAEAVQVASPGASLPLTAENGSSSRGSLLFRIGWDLTVVTEAGRA
jgi:hypothetical protein